jgi:hypothetical protein
MRRPRTKAVNKVNRPATAPIVSRPLPAMYLSGRERCKTSPRAAPAKTTRPTTRERLSALIQTPHGNIRRQCVGSFEFPLPVTYAIAFALSKSFLPRGRGQAPRRTVDELFLSSGAVAGQGPLTFPLATFAVAICNGRFTSTPDNLVWLSFSGGRDEKGLSITHPQDQLGCKKGKRPSRGRAPFAGLPDSPRRCPLCARSKPPSPSNRNSRQRDGSYGVASSVTHFNPAS